MAWRHMPSINVVPQERLRDMKVALLDADVNLRIANTIIDNVKTKLWA
jgi:signal recognition particle GTPase